MLCVLCLLFRLVWADCLGWCFLPGFVFLIVCLLLMLVDVADVLDGGCCLWCALFGTLLLHLLWWFAFDWFLFGIGWSVGVWLPLGGACGWAVFCCAGCRYAFVVLLLWVSLSIVFVLGGLVLVAYGGFAIGWFGLGFGFLFVVLWCGFLLLVGLCCLAFVVICFAC